jgi:hypothetical protein
MRLLVLIAVTWLVSGVESQTPADFSGRWTIETAPAEAAKGAPPARGDMGSGWGTTIAITQDAKAIVVESIVYSRYDLQPQPRFVYALDGSETRNTLMLGRGFQPQTSRTRWEGQRLAITTVHAFADPASGKPLTVEVTQTLSLESPTKLVVEATRAGVLGAKPSTTKTAYVKGG